MKNSNRFINPNIFASISDLELVAQKIVDGFMNGSHPGQIAGSGLEFNQYRSYQPGDDVQHIDWKVFARSDRYYIRESEVESRIAVQIILDASSSMQHHDGNMTKFDFARYLGAALSYLAFQQGDAVGLLAIQSDTPQLLPARHDRYQLHRFISTLSNLECNGRWPEWPQLEAFALHANRRRLIIIITDLYENDTEMHDALSKLNTLGNEVSLIHLMAPNELELNYGNKVVFEDLESGRAIRATTEEIRPQYLNNLSAHLKRLSGKMIDLQVDYHLVRTDEPLDSSLRHFLRRRQTYR